MQASVALQVKRKPETTISTESMIGGISAGARKRDKPTEQIKTTQSKLSISEIMDIDEKQEIAIAAEQKEKKEKISTELSSDILPDVLNNKEANKSIDKLATTKNNASSNATVEEVPPTKLTHSTTSEPKSVSNKFIRAKTIEAGETAQTKTQPQLERKDSIPNESAIKPSGERRRSRILETAEKFEAANAPNDKPKKFVVPVTGVSTKKEYERKTSLPLSTTSPVTNEQMTKHELNKIAAKEESSSTNSSGTKLVQSDSKGSNLSLEEARRSMENSIALLNRAKTEENNDVDQLCAKTENVAVSGENDDGERQKKLKNAREIIGNAIPRLSGMG